MTKRVTLLLLLSGSCLVFGQTVVNGGRVNLGNQDSSRALATSPMRTGTGSPAGACTPGQQYFQSDAVAGSNIWGCTATGWAQQTAALGAPYLLTRLNQMLTGANIGDPHQIVSPIVDYHISDGLNGQTGSATIQTGGRIIGYFFNTHNWQPQNAKDTVLLRQITGNFGSGQTNVSQMTLNKYGKGDGALIDGIVNCKGEGNTAGDEGCTAFRAELNGSYTSYSNPVGPRGGSTCTATLAQNITPVNNTTSSSAANGVNAQTVLVTGMSNCNAGDYVMFDAPPNLALENELVTQDGHDAESLKLAAVNAAAGTMAAYFKGVHFNGSAIRGERYMTKNPDPVLGNTQYDDRLNAKSLLINGNQAKWYRTGTVSQVPVPGSGNPSSNNSNAFALDAGSGGTWSAGMFGGNSNFPGMCIAMAQDDQWKPDGVQPSWLQVRSIDSTGTLTTVDIQHYNKINHSAYLLAPCTSVEAVELDTTVTPAQVGKVVLYPQPFGVVNGVNYDFETGDLYISATGSQGLIAFANVIGRTSAPYQRMAGLVFKPQGAAVFDAPLRFTNGDQQGMTQHAEYGNFTNRTSVTIGHVFNPHKAAAYFYNSSGQTGGLMAVQPTCYPGNGGDASLPASESLTCTFAAPASGSFAVYHAIAQYNSIMSVEGNYYRPAVVISGEGLPDVQTSPNVQAPPAFELHTIPHFDQEPTKNVSGTQRTLGYDGKAIAWVMEDASQYRLEVDWQHNLRLITTTAYSDIFHWNRAGATVMALPQITPTATDPVCTVAGDLGKQWVQTVDANNTVYRICLKSAGTIAWVTK